MDMVYNRKKFNFMAELIKMKTGYIPEPELGKGVVYVLEIDDGTVKVGYSTNFAVRLQDLKSAYKKYDKTILRYACTDNIRGYVVLEEYLHEGLDKWNVETPVNCESYKLPFDITVDKLIPWTAYYINILFNIDVI